MANAIDALHEMIPEDYDFDKEAIAGVTKVSKMIATIVQATELEVRTYANGDKHFMARIQGTLDENGFSLDDVADFILKPDFTIEYAFTGQEGSDESDFIFIGDDRTREHLDAQVRTFMDRFDYPQASFDEWLMEHGEKLSKENYTAAQNLLQRYPEYGGDLT